MFFYPELSAIVGVTHRNPAVHAFLRNGWTIRIQMKGALSVMSNNSTHLPMQSFLEGRNHLSLRTFHEHKGQSAVRVSVCILLFSHCSY